MDLNGKVAIVTGGASGIGKASAAAFARAGARVAVVDRDQKGALATAADVGGCGYGCNVGSEAEVTAMVRQASADLGPIDVLFNNAGIATGGDPLTTPPAVWQQQWEVNVMAHVWAIRAALPAMLERGSGYILHTASMAGILTTHGNSTYATTKHAVVGLAEWMAITYHDQGIRTSLLAPLGVRTPMLGPTDSAWASTAAGPIKEPEDVADMVVEAITEERFLILTDPIAQTWMDRKNENLDRWLGGMRRLQAKIDSAPE